MTTSTANILPWSSRFRLEWIFSWNGAVYGNYRARAPEAVPLGFSQTVHQSEGRKRQNFGVASLHLTSFNLCAWFTMRIAY